MRGLTIRHHVARMEFVGVDKSARCGMVDIAEVQHGAELSTPAMSTPANSAFPQ